MPSERQIAANRLNARRSIGPKIPGRLRSRRNALTHGLTETTVVDVFEDDTEFVSLKDQIVSAYQPVSSIHQELVHRLVAVLSRPVPIQNSHRNDNGPKPGFAISMARRWIG